MEKKLRDYLTKNGLKLSLAESCTGGLISSFITNIEGASKFFEQSFITYSNNSKIKILEIDPAIMAECGPVSHEIASQMAGGLVKLYADVGLATTGILGPAGGTDENPVGTAYIGIAKKEKDGSIKCTVVKYESKEKERVDIKRDIAQRAFLHLCKFLEIA